MTLTEVLSNENVEGTVYASDIDKWLGGNAYWDLEPIQRKELCSKINELKRRGK